MSVPIYYDYATQLENFMIPGAVKNGVENITTRYYTDYLLKRAMSVLKFSGIPDGWDINYFLYCLYVRGFVVVIDSPTFGVIPQEATLSGYNIYYAPTTAYIANPALPSTETGGYWLAEKYNKRQYPAIKGTCVLVRLQPNYKGLLDVCSITAQRLAYLHSAFMTNAANAKFAQVFGTDDKGVAAAFKAMIDDIQSGNIAVAVDNNLFNAIDGKPRWAQFVQNLQQNYIGTNLLEDIRSVLNDFDNFVGIPSTNYNKKAHMTVAEIGANDVETESLVDLMLETVQDGIGKVNARYGLNITVAKRYGEGVQTDVSESNDSRLV